MTIRYNNILPDLNIYISLVNGNVTNEIAPSCRCSQEIIPSRPHYQPYKVSPPNFLPTNKREKKLLDPDESKQGQWDGRELQRHKNMINNHIMRKSGCESGYENDINFHLELIFHPHDFNLFGCWNIVQQII